MIRKQPCHILALLVIVCISIVSDNFDELVVMQKKLLKPKGKTQIKRKSSQAIVSSDDENVSKKDFKRARIGRIEEDSDDDNINNESHENEILKLKERISELESENVSLKKELDEVNDLKSPHMQNLMAQTLQLLNKLQEIQSAESSRDIPRQPSVGKPSPIFKNVVNLPESTAKMKETISSGSVQTNNHIATGTPSSYQDQLKYKSTDEDVVRLLEQEEIYIAQECLHNILATSFTASAMARHLAKALFTEKALTTCSVYGGKSKGPRGQQTDCRKPLHGGAIQAIITFCTQKAEAAQWPVTSKKDIVHTLGSLLSTSRRRWNENM